MRAAQTITSHETSDLFDSVAMPEVLRVASELYAQDRAQIERTAQRQELKQAAAEAGLPPEYLERAATLLKSQRQALPRRRSRKRAGLMAALALTVTVALGLSFNRGSGRVPTMTPVVASGSFAHADLRGVSFKHANLAGQDMSMANLRGAQLNAANLRGASLNGADLRGADLTGADLAGADVSSALYDDTTRWPSGFDPSNHGARWTGR
jgi:hypothetical protein